MPFPRSVLVFVSNFAKKKPPSKKTNFSSETAEKIEKYKSGRDLAFFVLLIRNVGQLVHPAQFLNILIIINQMEKKTESSSMPHNKTAELFTLWIREFSYHKAPRNDKR